MYCLQPWLRSDGLGKKRNKTLGMIPHDMYIIGTQESALSDKEWTNRIRSILMETFGEEFYLVRFLPCLTERINRSQFIHQFTYKTRQTYHTMNHLMNPHIYYYFHDSSYESFFELTYESSYESS